METTKMKIYERFWDKWIYLKSNDINHKFYMIGFYHSCNRNHERVFDVSEYEPQIGNILRRNRAVAQFQLFCVFWKFSWGSRISQELTNFQDATVNVRNKHIFSWVWHTFTLSLSHMIGFVRFRRSSGLLDLVLFSQDHESDQRVFQLTKQILAVIDKTYLSEPKIGFKNCTLYFIWYIIWNLISY